jgi:alpha-L-fucosidase 2
MLVQSHNGFIEILPALPKVWGEGAVRGLKARGDVTIDIRWKNGAPEIAVLRAGHDGPIALRSPLLARAFSLVDAGTQKPVSVTGDGVRRSFVARRDTPYELRFQP